MQYKTNRREQLSDRNAENSVVLFSEITEITTQYHIKLSKKLL